ncbi:uncharacterized protein UHOD_11980 [Ustilago sp. UG-2017b]|nr:uncharacterized protein UHOD_11980 [Ustilago sp. UG-2017b]
MRYTLAPDGALGLESTAGKSSLVRGGEHANVSGTVHFHWLTAGGHNRMLQAPQEDGRGLQCNVGMGLVVQATSPIVNTFASLAPVHCHT